MTDHPENLNVIRERFLQIYKNHLTIRKIAENDPMRRDGRLDENGDYTTPGYESFYSVIRSWVWGNGRPDEEELKNLQKLHTVFPIEFEHDKDMLYWIGYHHLSVHQDFSTAMTWFDKYLCLAGTDKKIDGRLLCKKELVDCVLHLVSLTNDKKLKLNDENISALYALCIQHSQITPLPANKGTLDNERVRLTIIRANEGLANWKLGKYFEGRKEYSMAVNAYFRAYTGYVTHPRGEEEAKDILCQFTAACKAAGQNPDECLRKFGGNPLHDPQPPISVPAFTMQ